MSKSEMKKKLQNFIAPPPPPPPPPPPRPAQNFIDILMKDYNDKLECFVRDEDDMIREFRSIIEDSDEV